MAERVRDLTGREVPIEYLELPEDDPKVRQPDITKARDLLGWSPNTPIEAGLKTTIEDFRRRMPAAGTA